MTFIFFFKSFNIVLDKGVIMSKKDKREMRNFAIMLNMAMGKYNLYIFVLTGSIINLLIGSANMGVFIFFRHKLQQVAS